MLVYREWNDEREIFEAVETTMMDNEVFLDVHSDWHGEGELVIVRNGRRFQLRLYEIL